VNVDEEKEQVAKSLDSENLAQKSWTERKTN
jgi:hypothetical protein